MRHVIAKSLLVICLVLSGGMFVLTSAEARDEWVTIKVMFCSEAVSPKLVSEYTGARLLSFKPPLARFAVPKSQREVYGLLFATLPYTHLTDRTLQQRAEALRQDIDNRQEASDGVDLNTLIVRFKQPDDKLLQEFALVFHVSIQQFVAPLELALVGIPAEQAHVYYTLLRHAPDVLAVDFNAISGLH